MLPLLTPLPAGTVTACFLLLRVLLLLFMKPFAARHACTGVIVNADQPADKRPKLQGAAFKGTPTRILLLRNMVGPGEVDEDLEEEVSCGAGGGVLLCLQVQ